MAKIFLHLQCDAQNQFLRQRRDAGQIVGQPYMGHKSSAGLD